MRSATIKWIILFSTISIGFLVGAQLYWLNKVYNYEQKEFNSSVVKSIQGVGEDLELMDSLSPHLQKLIEQPGASSFLFKIDVIPDKDTLIDDVLSNLEAFELFADCQVALYDANKQAYIYSDYLKAAGTSTQVKNAGNVPLYKRSYSYILLYFPNRKQYIISAMTWWIASSSILLLLLVGLGLSIFYLYRQKFLNEIQNDFIRNVTHEFQTPLTTLTVGLDAISKSSIIDHPEKLAKYTKLMQGQTIYLKQHLDNLMKVLKAEANGIILKPEPVDPNELVQTAIQQLFVSIEDKKADINFSSDETHSLVQANSGDLYLAILNIISNALKYSEEPVIDIKNKVADSKYTISVKDNGIGIEEQYQKKLFKKFYRVPTGDIHSVKGLGLGLYFANKMILQQKGRIIINSRKGMGSEFIIELPIIKSG